MDKRDKLKQEIVAFVSIDEDTEEAFEIADSIQKTLNSLSSSPPDGEPF